jgi:hypothetical protein
VDVGGGAERGQRPLGEDAREVGVGRQFERALGVRGAQFRSECCEESALGEGTVLLGGRASQEVGAQGGHHRHVDAGRDLQLRRVRPRGEVVGERLETEGPGSLRIERDLG